MRAPGHCGARLLLAALVLSLALAPGPVRAEDLEAKLKSAFLLNFVRFIRFPAERYSSPDAPVDICVLTPDPLAEALEQSLAGKVVGGHPVRLRRGDRPEALRDCHLVFVGSRSSDLLDSQLARLAGFGVLSVHESGAPKSTGVIRLYSSDNYLRFEINQAAAERERLEPSAGLLEIATRIRL
ncbi:MAG: YfiR family protein [Nevskiaceae bacterium]|nr:MAG: YfiR family protein [Nevskiaceae bacterium]